jgi:hypothetical protein
MALTDAAFCFDGLDGFGCLLKVGIGFVCVGDEGRTSGPFRNLPIGDKDRILNLEDFTVSGVGEDGRIDLRIAGDGDPGGEIARTCFGAGALARMVGVGSCLIEPRIVYRPPCSRPRFLTRWKLLAEASESLSYVGAGAALGFAEGMLCGLPWAAAAGGMFFF